MLEKVLNNENIPKLFLQEKSNYFVVLKTYFSIYVQNCGSEEKLNLSIFPLLRVKNAQTGRGSATCLSGDISNFSYV
jgi:hypothetical protein